MDRSWGGPMQHRSHRPVLRSAIGEPPFARRAPTPLNGGGYDAVQIGEGSEPWVRPRPLPIEHRLPHAPHNFPLWRILLYILASRSRNNSHVTGDTPVASFSV